MKTLVLASVLALSAALPARAENLGTLEASWPAGGIQRVKVEFPVGDLDVIATDAPTVRALMTVRCRGGGRGCVQRSKRLRLVSNQRGGTRFVKVEGFPKFSNLGIQVSLRVEVPRSRAVDLEMGVGDLNVDGIEGDVSAELGVGDVEVSMRERDVNSVRLAVGIGDASLDRAAHRQQVSGFLGKKVHWSEGSGRSHVSVDLGIGDISMRLR